MAVQISGNDITVPRDGSFTRNVTIGGTLTYEDVTNIDSVGLVTARTGIEIGARPGVAASISVDGNMIVSGISTFNGDVKLDGGNLVLGDSGGATDDRLTFGAGTDLSIYHDASHSRIVDSGTGHLIIQTSELDLMNAAGNEDMLKATADGAVELYHNNSKKIETTSYGVLSAAQVRVSSSNASTVAFSAGDVGTGFYNTGSNAIGYSANGTQKWSIDSGGNLRLVDNVQLRIGDSDDLQIYHDASNTVLVNNTGDLYIQNDASNTVNKILIRPKAGEASIECVPDAEVSLFHNNSVRLLTTTSGVTAGTPNTSQTAVVGAQAGFFGGAKSLYASATGLVQNQVCILDTATSAAAGTGGALTFAGYTDSDSTTFYATIEGVKENSTVNQYGGELRFLTRAHNVGNMNQAMMIDSAGKVFVSNMGRGVDGSTSNLAVYGNSSTATGNVPLSCYPANASSTRHMISFSNANGVIGSISTNGSNTAYNTSSDYRLKENTVAISDGITRLKTLKPIRFNFIKDASTTIDGFLAHEVSDAVPSAVTGEKDGMAGETFYEEGDELPSGKEYGDVKTYSTTKIEPQQLDQTKLVPLLTAALQEAVTEIESLKARLDAAGL